MLQFSTIHVNQLYYRFLTRGLAWGKGSLITHLSMALVNMDRSSQAIRLVGK